MKFEFIISKLVNLFFFVDNFSEWNIYCRKNYNKEWLNQLGKLNQKEKIALKNYRALMQKHEKNNLYKKIRNIFYNDEIEKIDDKIIKKMEKLISIKDACILFDSIDALYPKFQMAWIKYQSILTYDKKIILKSYKDIKNDFNLIFSKIAKFYGKKIKKQILLDVYLKISPIKGYQGGKAIDKNKISIEVNRLDYKNKNQLVGFWFLVVHEIIHANFENQKYKRWIKKFIEQQFPLKSKIVKKLGTKNVLREIITATATTATDSLLTKIKKEKTDWQKLTEKQLKTLGVDNLNTLRRWAGYDLKKIINQYFNNNKKIDKLFLKKCWNFIDDYPKNLLRKLKINR